MYPFLYFYGIGNGIFIKLLLGNSIVKRILIVEPEIEMLYIAFNFADFSQEITDGRLAIEHSLELDFTRAVSYISHNEGQLFTKLYELLTPTKYYYTFYQKEAQKVNKIFSDAIYHVIVGHGNDAIDSLIGIENHIQNLFEMIKNPKFTTVLDKKNTDTAIIVSTGPSLTKQLPLLKEIQDFVTIVSVDASLPILEKNGIVPDFVTVIERVPETAKFFKQTSSDFQKKTTVICASLIHKETLEAIKGPKVITMRPHNYTKYFELDEFGYIGHGMSAANLAHELTVVMGFKKCILIGQDLAFSEDGNTHAKGHVFGEKDNNYKYKDLLVEKYGGGGTVKTAYIWNLFRDYFEKLSAQTKHLTEVINCTEGGSRIPETTEMSFKDAIEKYIDKSKKKEKIKLSSPTKREQEKYAKRIIKKINKIFKYADRYQKRIEKVFLDVSKASEELIKLNKEEKLDKINFKKLQSLNKKIDKVKTIFENEDFRAMFYNTVQPYIIHQELELAKIQVQPIKTDIEKKAKLVDWIMNHRYWLFSLAGGISAERDVIERAVKTWPTKYFEKIVFPEKSEIKN